MRILIEIEVDAELTDAKHSSGLTDEAYIDIFTALSPYGDDINIEAAVDE